MRLNGPDHESVVIESGSERAEIIVSGLKIVEDNFYCAHAIDEFSGYPYRVDSQITFPCFLSLAGRVTSGAVPSGTQLQPPRPPAMVSPTRKPPNSCVIFSCPNTMTNMKFASSPSSASKQHLHRRMRLRRNA